jgi:predicted NAD-dependent protein-ADP-ribosyltransferase YbiA (DUF1768 family)
MSDNSPIYFFGQNNRNGYMSNFYESYFVDEEENKFNCSEQYFMYRKCKRFDNNNTRLLNAILHLRRFKMEQRSQLKTKRFAYYKACKLCF